MAMITSLSTWLRSNEHTLAKSGIDTARLDCLVLLENELAINRAKLLANQHEILLTTKQINRLAKQVKRRATHEPLAYIRGKTEFYGHEFFVSKDTLEPRPESEDMIAILQSLSGIRDNDHLVDVGTGSAALAICSQLVLPNIQVSATEISQKAITIAEKNVARYNLHIPILHGNLLDPLSTPPDVILANLPYVPNSHTINKAAMQEPAIAIFGGDDGLDVYREMFSQMSHRKWRPIYILTESLPPQHRNLETIANAHGYQQTKEADFIQLFEPTTD